MMVGDIRRVKNNQEYTCEEARGKMCVIETAEPNMDFRIRIQRDDFTHLNQWAKEHHLEAV